MNLMIASMKICVIVCKTSMTFPEEVPLTSLESAIPNLRGDISTDASMHSQEIIEVIVGRKKHMIRTH